tara:strand:- start:899 stop:1744 length:846 start_codon:yes stop_codon:yes gene_type:complete
MYEMYENGVLVPAPSFVNGTLTPLMFGKEYEDITFQSDVGMLPGYLTEGSSGVVIWFHGFGSNYKRQGLALRIAKDLDYKFMIINTRGTYGEPNNGIYTHGTTEWPDIDAAVAYAKHRFPTLPVFLHGVSSGALPIASWEKNSIHTDLVAGIVYDVPSFNFKSSIIVQGKSRFPPSVVPETWYPYILAFSETLYGVNFDDYNYLDTVVDPRIPALFISVDLDENVDSEDVKYVQARRSENATYVFFENTTHARGYWTDNVLYMSSLKNFFDTQINVKLNIA